MHEQNDFPASEAHRLDEPARKEWLPPADVLRALATYMRGRQIADVGAGTGYFSLAAGASCRPQGQGLCGRRTGRDALPAQAEDWIRPNSPTSSSIHAEAEQTGLPASSCDLFFLANVWHEIEDRSRRSAGSNAGSQDGRQNAILDWRPDVEPGARPSARPSSGLIAHHGEHASRGFRQARRPNIGRYSWLVKGRNLQ